MVFLYCDGKTTTPVLSQEIGAPTFTVGRYLKSIDLLSRDKDKVIAFYDSVLSLDYRIKTGQLPESAFWWSLKSSVYALEQI